MPALAVASLVVQWIVLLFIAVLLAGALREIGLLRLRLGEHPGALITDAGLPLGSVPPIARFVDYASGETHTLADLVGKRSLLAVLSTNCMACHDLVPHLHEIADTQKSQLRVVALMDATEDGIAQFARHTSLRLPIWFSPEDSITKSLQTPGSPFIYVLGEDLRVQARGVANDWIGLESLLSMEGTLQAGREWVTATPVGPESESRKTTN